MPQSFNLSAVHPRLAKMLQSISAVRPAGWWSNTILFVLGIVSVGGGYRSNLKLVTVCGVFATLWSFISFILSRGHTKERDPGNPPEEQTQVQSPTLHAIPTYDPFISAWDPVDFTGSQPTPESVLFTREGTGLEVRPQARRILRVSNPGSPEPGDLPDWMEAVKIEPFWEGSDGERGGA
ncbi:hypothetical protein BDP27DRAFT_1352652 [Rhodocollybia butyracea]|uniref:Uncharacterized protein n=1 Tax=Rhodocollybia butyracea TaxID=206335 RepID=A0A9P5TV38_9AGAR|nr:hypothetical protein BDP27DRAFT_1352652 [Rhodocollybia butyracea]